MAKATFSDEQLETLLAVLRKHRKRFENQTKMALALGVSQPSLSALLLGKWHPGVTTARAIAALDGMTLEDLVGAPAGEQPPPPSAGVAVPGGSHLPGLDACLTFFRGSKDWTNATIAAAKAGAWGDDADPPAWEARLDALDQAIRRATAGKVRRR